MSDRPVVLLDCDGVLADFVVGFLAVLNKRLGTDYKPHQITQWDIDIALGIPEQLFFDIVKTPGFCAELPVLPGAQDGVRALKEVANVVVVTAPVRSETWMKERTQWLDDYFCLKPIYTNDKTLVCGDVLVDDRSNNVRDWAKCFPSSVAVLWDAPYNQCESSDLSTNVVRSNSWEDVLALVR